MRRDQQRLQDMLEALDSVARMISGHAETEFLADETPALRSPIDCLLLVRRRPGSATR